MISETMLETGHTFVVDLTRHQGDSQSLINSVDRHVRSKYPAAKVTWFARPNQVALLNGVENVIEWNRFGSGLATAVKELIQRMSRDAGNPTVFHVLTYDRLVLDAAESLNELSLIVVTQHMTKITDSQNGSRHAAPRPFNPPESVPSLPVEEALQLTRQILQRGDHTSPDTALTLSKLRPALSGLDIRARKNFFDRKSVDLITKVIAAGEQLGWIKQFRVNDRSGSEHIWLDESATNAEPSEIGEGRPAENVSPQTPLTTPSVEESQESTALPTETKLRRSELMETELRKRGIGSPAIVREYLFAAVEEVIGTIEGPTTAELISAARTRAKQAYEAAGHSKSQNWEAIGDCFLRMLLIADVLLKADQSPIRDGIGAYSARVSKLAPNFRERSEASLLEVIIKRMGDVNYSELYNLGLALFHQGKESALTREKIVEKTDRLLELLLKDNRIEIDAEGYLTIAPTSRVERKLAMVQ